LREQALDVIAQLAHEFGNVGVAGGKIPGQSHELHVLLAGPLNGAAADQASGIRERHDLDHDPGVVGRGAGLIVLEPGVER